MQALCSLSPLVDGRKGGKQEEPDKQDWQNSHLLEFIFHLQLIDSFNKLLIAHLVSFK